MSKKNLETELQEIVKLCPTDRQAVAARLADELVFMHGTLSELKTQIKQKGVLDRFKNGSQDFMRESPALKGYQMIIKQYSSVYKQLCDLLPKSVTVENSSAVYEFIK